jgi:hypothetical protein
MRVQSSELVFNLFQECDPSKDFYGLCKWVRFINPSRHRTLILVQPKQNLHQHFAPAYHSSAKDCLDGVDVWYTGMARNDRV